MKSSPATIYHDDRNIVIVGSHDHWIYALDIDQRQCLWTYSGTGACVSTPTVNEGNYIFVTLLNGEIHCLDLLSGTNIWKTDLRKPIFSSPCLFKKLLLVTCVDGVLYAFSTDGRMMWTFVTNGPIFSTPIAVELNSSRFILFGNNSGVTYCLDDRGELVWSFVGDSQIYSSLCTYPNIVGVSHSKANSYTNNSIFVLTICTSGFIYLLRLSSGECVMSCHLPGEIFSSPVLVDSDILVGCRDNFLYCLTVNSC